MKFIWTSYEFHMNEFDLISYEIHEKFIWTSYEAHAKFTINSYVVQINFIWGYEYMVSQGLHMNEPPGPSYITADWLLTDKKSFEFGKKNDHTI